MTCSGTLWQVIIRVYRLVVQSVMLVFSTQMCELLPLGREPQTDKHLPQSPFTAKFFRWRHLALASILLISSCSKVKTSWQHSCCWYFCLHCSTKKIPCDLYSLYNAERMGEPTLWNLNLHPLFYLEHGFSWRNICKKGLLLWNSWEILQILALLSNF